tara:strand:- start:343 stop:492 length:150 start_codon:yes stop_codon:yes gene_type:complete
MKPFKSTKQRGIFATTGLVDSANLPKTVYPFILKGVSFLEIDFVEPQLI